MRGQWKERMTGADLGFDVILLLVVITMLTAGLITVASTTWGVSYVYYEAESVWVLFLRQLGWAGIGLVFLGVMYVLDYHIFFRVKGLVVLLALATVAALIAVVILKGDSLTRVGLFGNSVQPSELAKLVTVIYLAVWLVSKAEVLHDVKLGLIPYAALIALFSGLIAIEPDYSAAVTVVLIGIAMFYFGGGKLHNVVIGSLVIGVGGILLAGVMRPQRILDYLAGWRNIREANLHIREALSAISSGGIFGVGAGASRFKYFSLPAAHTDSVFAVIGEELGLLGALFVLVLFAVLIWRGYRIAMRARDELGLLLAAGITSWVALEAVINILTILQVLPFAGNALPFFSYGGSNLVLTLGAMGMLLNISRSPGGGAAEATGEDTTLRRGDGGRNLPRPRNGAGASAFSA
ncbi:MAG: FtsW/RodA/SpoVE family cell cycle protein [Anaerolineales bacterium]|nr:FtsW/RodA/SpoVE family cell cycle protein [Anaerolineales bacterium]